MGQYELAFAIFLIIIAIYAIVVGLKLLLSKGLNSDKEIIEKAKERKNMK